MNQVSKIATSQDYCLVKSQNLLPATMTLNVSLRETHSKGCWVDISSPIKFPMRLNPSSSDSRTRTLLCLKP